MWIDKINGMVDVANVDVRKDKKRNLVKFQLSA